MLIRGAFSVHTMSQFWDDLLTSAIGANGRSVRTRGVEKMTEYFIDHEGALFVLMIRWSTGYG